MAKYGHNSKRICSTFERRKRNFPFLTSNIPPKPHYITVFHQTSNPENMNNMKHFSQEEKEKQRTESHESRVERDFCLHNLENRKEKEI